MPNWNAIEGSLATPKGFRAAAAAAGIKKAPGALDLALVVCDEPRASAAGVFTTNRAAAAPVLLCRQNMKKNRGRARAIIANSGNANACTGRAGFAVAEQTGKAVARLLGVQPHEVIVSSTGVIGTPLNLGLILKQLPTLKEILSAESAPEVPRALMTTDSFPKSAVLQSKIGGRTVTLAGVAKGAGMIHPNMATMLSYITTDAAVAPALLQKTLRAAVDASFNRITVDGDTSTSDTLLLCATGQAAHRRVSDAGDPLLKGFRAALEDLLIDLAQQVVRDGEGAQKFVTITIGGAASARAARRIGLAIANSPLVKTAIAGQDPNWGRIVMAVGKAGEKADRDRLAIRIGGLEVARDGQVVPGYDEAPVARHMTGRDIEIEVDVGVGRGRATVWTCDLTHGYIDINADYRS